jgi:hypothetical protein
LWPPQEVRFDWLRHCSGSVCLRIADVPCDTHLRGKKSSADDHVVATRCRISAIRHTRRTRFPLLFLAGVVCLVVAHGLTWWAILSSGHVSNYFCGSLRLFLSLLA